MNITVVGTGYVGLVTGSCFASTGNKVVCVDIDEEKVARMSGGLIPIYEPGLEAMFEKALIAGDLGFTTDLAQAVANANVIFLALPTPSGDDGQADLSYVEAVADQLGSLLQQHAVIVNKSTVPVGTADNVRERIEKYASHSFDVVSNPEFLREGHAVRDFMQPDRIVIGTTSEKALATLRELYKPFVQDDERIIHMDERSAEMTKYAANSFLALKVTFMNEIANLSEELGANVDDIRRGIGSDDRIGDKFLQAGIGFGGSCFPKDVLALRHMAESNDYEFHILDAIVKVNTKQKRRLMEKVLRYFEGDIGGKHFALWGLAFKPDTDDIRESPALDIIDAILANGATVTAYDPEAMPNMNAKYGYNKNLTFAEDQYSALNDADALLIATEWKQFREPDFEAMKKQLKDPIIFDGRNIYSPEVMRDKKFYYESIGRNAYATQAEL